MMRWGLGKASTEKAGGLQKQPSLGSRVAEEVGKYFWQIWDSRWFVTIGFRDFTWSCRILARLDETWMSIPGMVTGGQLQKSGTYHPSLLTSGMNIQDGFLATKSAMNWVLITIFHLESPMFIEGNSFPWLYLYEGGAIIGDMNGLIPTNPRIETTSHLSPIGCTVFNMPLQDSERKGKPSVLRMGRKTKILTTQWFRELKGLRSHKFWLLWIVDLAIDGRYLRYPIFIGRISSSCWLLTQICDEGPGIPNWQCLRAGFNNASFLSYSNLCSFGGIAFPKPWLWGALWLQISRNPPGSRWRHVLAWWVIFAGSQVPPVYRRFRAFWEVATDVVGGPQSLNLAKNVVYGASARSGYTPEISPCQNRAPPK